MTSRSAVLLLTLLVILSPSGRAAPPAGTPDFLDGDTTATLTLEAPLKDLFERGAEDENVAVPGTVTFKDASGKDVVFRDVKVSVRGHTSRREAECTFPKLKLKFPDKASLKIGTHCGENAGETLSTKYGRLANELSPRREALVYRLLHAVEAPTLRARPAHITYVDAGQRLERNALLLEDDDDALKRFGGEREVTMESFGDVKARNAAGDAARIAFAEAMIGNFDWCMRFAPDDIYRCNQPKPLWNVLAFERGDGRTGLAIKDFDLAGTVVGGHPWFKDVFTPAFVASKSKSETEVIAQVQRTRSLFPRAQLDAERKHLMDRRGAVYAAIDTADVDTRGREIARGYVDAFYRAIADEAYYRPVVAKESAQLFADAGGATPACGAKDLVRVGTPVNVLQKSGTMSQVVLLDIMWRWAQADPCPAILRGPVWIASDAVSADYPSR
jgi:hypothetical protein